MAIMTLTGRPVKRPGRLVGAAQLVKTPQLLRALRRAKAPAPWAGWGCVLTPEGMDMTDAGLEATGAESTPEPEAVFFETDLAAAWVREEARTPAPPLTWEQTCVASDLALSEALGALRSERGEAADRGDSGAVAALLGRIDDIESEISQRRAWREGGRG